MAIVGFSHKGLQKFWDTGSTAKIQHDHARKLSSLLNTIDAAEEIEELNLPSFRLHQLKGTRSEIWSIHVNGNWCVTFRFNNGNAEIVNYEDYHDKKLKRGKR